ncbi:hypothetical protein H310_08261 [Aphanomyces invadans]|uniref:Helicase-associated domain-containing protein n=1 Tax=Aphanomyces invadans TaxID=157072 RepID=A0A024TZK6_9STRA|nr:hypothetical protein H310_08261 [Aphanomyces invadans]ETV99610.1 hypothetical protein H310_08261 [Aphanomyces invadans]|eukprot:XP_008872166.1 hypothetical protein H310_08261 [Aphanomyces invadans]
MATLVLKAPQLRACFTRAFAASSMPLSLQKIVVKLATDAYDPAVSKYTTLPAQLTVPSLPDFPASLHGSWVNVSALRELYRKNKVDREIVEALDKVGFIWDMRQHKWTLVIEALNTYLKLNGHVIVPRRFVIPQNDERWPQDTWNWKLGRIVDNIRLRLKKDLHADRVAALDQLGFVWSVHEYEWQQNMELLTTFHRLYGHVNIPNTFVVPCDSNEWPAFGGGMRLGLWVQNLRMRKSTLSESRLVELQSVDFVWDAHDESWQINMRALKWFKFLKGHVNVPKRFVTTEEWPIELRDVHLGAFLHNSRHRKGYLDSDRRVNLNSLGVHVKKAET